MAACHVLILHHRKMKCDGLAQTAAASSGVQLENFTTAIKTEKDKN